MAAVRPDENQGPTILGATLSVFILAVITTIARLYVRIRMIRNVGWDDYTMILSMVLCIAGQCVIIPQVYYGAGRHIEYIDPKDFPQAMKLNFISQPIYLFAICFVKISVGFFLLRIAVRPFFRRLITGIMIFMGVYTFGCVLTVFLQCSDVRMMWDLTVKGTCWTVTQIKILGYLNTVLNMITDLAFSIGIPIPMLWGVQMNRRHKASLICILGLGLFATAASMIKLSYIGNYGRAGDLMWDSRNLTIWTVQECNVGMVAGNLPCLKPLFRSILVSTYGKGSGKTTQPKYFSDAYAAGTKERSTNKSYGPLGSPKLEDRGFFDGGEAPAAHHAMGGKSYMLTTIDATHAHQTTKDTTTTTTTAPSVNSSGRSSPAAVGGDARSSTESFARLNRHTSVHGRGGAHELGNITVTTEVDVSESVRSPFQDSRPAAQFKGRNMV
ncbi:hypothetical protein COCCADRAFT_4378 [Bipolaris zeicola 26-R-13]|uniref:Rhodopsin domain-containing protein n=1 Tax=Cochliobolus carbonum (strain 26-R-13) TaxID=930089 RepID=W6Y9N8_COCC2|nr:uncharacterized protein COCCADRAFT_4378 [Bipolaris zeicola 26-R-13]EUC34235.1 hypothetical protein COCCADRAFT_4378 [Bipolaris zeicola 26-R-13]